SINIRLLAELKKMRIKLQTLLTLALTFSLSLSAIAQGQSRSKSKLQSFDIIIRGGTLYDGSGRPPIKADVGIKGDRITAIGNLSRATAPPIVNARGFAFAPGFISMFSHPETSLTRDPRSVSELKQGVPTQI